MFFITLLSISAIFKLLGIQLANSGFPVGKVDFLSLFPMSFAEFLEGTGDAKSTSFMNTFNTEKTIPDIVHWHLWNQLKIYLVVGGLPEAVKTYANKKDNLFDALTDVRKKQENLITTYHADMAKHSGKQNAMHLERLWRNIPAQLARDQNRSAPKFKFKNIIPGINRFSQLAGMIDWLKAAGLIIQVHIVNKGELPFSAYIKENSFKLYIFDVGILGALSQLPAKTILEYDYGSYKGYYAENFVAQAFLCSGVNDLYSWRERTAEVEFLREIDGKILPVEVKSGRITQAKSLKVFSQKYHPPYRTIMSAKNLHIDTKNNVHRYPLYFASQFPISAKK